MRLSGWAIASVLVLSTGTLRAQTSAGSDPQPGQVTFRAEARALDAIIAIGLATHAPIGLLPGQDTTALCKTRYRFNLTDMDATTALLTVAQQMQYSWYEEDGVMILRAPDLTPRQTELIERRIPEFPAQERQVTALLSANLGIALWVIDHPNQGYGGSIGHGTNDVRLSLPQLKDVTALQVANRVVTMGSGGIWMSGIRPQATDDINGYDILLGLYQDAHPLKNFLACTW